MRVDMVREDKLCVTELRMQCIEIQRDMQRNNEILNKHKKSMLEFQSNQNMQGSAYKAAKEQIERYTTLMNTIKIANDYICRDCSELSALIGEKSYLGQEIFDTIEQTKIKIEYYKSEQSKFWHKAYNETNTWKKAYFKCWSDYYLNFQVNYQNLLHKYEKKIEEFDAIVAKTAYLFSQIDNSYINVAKAITGLSKVFQNGKYDSKASKEWDDTYYRPLSECVQRKNLSLNGGKFITVKNEDGSYNFGGKLDYYKEFIKDPKEYVKFIRHGSGLLAMTHFGAYLRSTRKLTSENRMEYLPQHFTASIHGMYCSEQFFKKDYLSDHEYPAIRPKGQERIGKDLQHVLNEVAQQYGFKGAHWSTDKKLEIQQIKDQIKRGVPVLLSVDPVAPKDCPELKLYKYYESTGTLKNFGVVEAVGQYVTITGVQEYGDIQTGENRQMLQVAVNGQEMFIDFDEFDKYRKSTLKEINLFDRDDYLATGKNNISVVEFN